MDADRLDRLTEGQRACLRLVLRHLSSKDIARELDISPHTVDQRLRIAMQKLGAGSRVQAAFMLAKHEGVPGYQSSVYQPSHIAADADRATVAPSEEGWRHSREALFEPVREHQIGFDAVYPLAHGDFRWPLPSRGARPHDLGPWQRLGWIAIIAISAALAFGALLAGLGALADLGRTIYS